MGQTCKIHAVPGINLILRQRWQFVAFYYIGVVNIWVAKSQPFWSSPGQVEQGEREQLAHRRLLDELAQQGWQPLADGECGRDWYNIGLHLPRSNGSRGAQLFEGHDHWILPVAGYKMTECEDFDDRALSDEARYLLEGPEEGWSLSLPRHLTYRYSDGLTWVPDPDDPLSALAPARAIIGLRIERAVAHENGRLDLAFADGSALSVDPMPDYEAWDIRGPRGILVVSTPGGGLAVWSDQS